MQKLYDFTVHTLFAGFLDDNAVRTQIAAHVPQNTLQDGWLFTLPELFSLVLILYERAGHKPEPHWRDRYIEFRQLLYSNPTNAVLKQCGGVVDIFAAHEDHAKTVYVLRRIVIKN